MCSTILITSLTIQTNEAGIIVIILTMRKQKFRNIWKFSNSLQLVNGKDCWLPSCVLLPVCSQQKLNVAASFLSAGRLQVFPLSKLIPYIHTNEQINYLLPCKRAIFLQFFAFFKQRKKRYQLIKIKISIFYISALNLFLIIINKQTYCFLSCEQFKLYFTLPF